MAAWPNCNYVPDCHCRCAKVYRPCDRYSDNSAGSWPCSMGVRPQLGSAKDWVSETRRLRLGRLSFNP